MADLPFVVVVVLLPVPPVVPVPVVPELCVVLVELFVVVAVWFHGCHTNSATATTITTTTAAMMPALFPDELDELVSIMLCLSARNGLPGTAYPACGVGNPRLRGSVRNRAVPARS